MPQGASSPPCLLWALPGLAGDCLVTESGGGASWRPAWVRSLSVSPQHLKGPVSAVWWQQTRGTGGGKGLGCAGWSPLPCEKEEGCPWGASVPLLATEAGLIGQRLWSFSHVVPFPHADCSGRGLTDSCRRYESSVRFLGRKKTKQNQTKHLRFVEEPYTVKVMGF